tara:strand:- start:122 stop:427 length:306 start_codon:yes stop_codon:yes gene_type:complete
MTLELFDNRVVIEPIEATQKTASGIILPDSDKKVTQGHVRYVGPGKTFDNGSTTPCSVVPGDFVLFDQYAGTKINWDANSDKEFIVMRDTDIIGKVKEPTN